MARPATPPALLPHLALLHPDDHHLDLALLARLHLADQEADQAIRALHRHRLLPLLHRPEGWQENSEQILTVNGEEQWQRGNYTTIKKIIHALTIIFEICKNAKLENGK
jgi:hypothetical protein